MWYVYLEADSTFVSSSNDVLDPIRGMRGSRKRSSDGLYLVMASTDLYYPSNET